MNAAIIHGLSSLTKRFGLCPVVGFAEEGYLEHSGWDSDPAGRLMVAITEDATFRVAVDAPRMDVSMLEGSSFVCHRVFDLSTPDSFEALERCLDKALTIAAYEVRQRCWFGNCDYHR